MTGTSWDFFPELLLLSGGSLQALSLLQPAQLCWRYNWVHQIFIQVAGID